MARGITVDSCWWGKFMLLLWLVQLAHGEANSACKNMPSFGKDDDGKCCDVPEVFTNETLHQCVDGLEQSGKAQSERSCIFANCIVNKNKFLKPDGHFDEDQFRSHIKDTVKASGEWKSLMERVVLEECIPMIQKDGSNILKQMKTVVGECDPVPAVVVACAAAKFHSKCPSKDWTGSQMCNEWKTYFSKCSNTLEDLNEMYLQIESQRLADG